ncbi:nucleotide-diphospho-sugar transferase [Saitoella complicata NRRL Y-17804]|nr:nucleotide-diphospho-sugar transferase [Saitoella complicata NRRL Y-17804]ODQ52684.1 nucleotide-diphospho-sugar transferase [Saitoella complicata NRRL Y-17804]
MLFPELEVREAGWDCPQSSVFAVAYFRSRGGVGQKTDIHPPRPPSPLLFDHPRSAVSPLAVDSSNPPKKAWACLLTGSPGYLSGFLTLHYSLRKHASKYPLIALLNPSDTLYPLFLSALQQRGIPHRDIEALRPVEDREFEGDPRFKECWTKLEMFGLYEFERVGFLDSDMLVLQNMDELFEIPLEPHQIAASAACVCNPRKRAHYPPTWIPENCAYSKQCYDPALAATAATDAIPPTFGLGALNSGLVILHPSPENYKRVTAPLSNPPLYRTFLFPDQDLLAHVFKGDWIPLPYVYNALKTLKGQHAEMWRDEEVKNLHFIIDKPWDDVDKKGEGKVLHGVWWGVDGERREWEKGVYGIESEE